MYICRISNLLLESMKKLLAIFLSFSSLIAATAQVPHDNVCIPFKRPLMIAVTYGRSINTGGNDNEYWFGRQPSNRGEFTIRAAYSLFSHWSIYGDMVFSSGGNWTPPIDIEWLAESSCGLPGSAGMGAGIMYRYENNRWQFFTRAGIGACAMDNADDYIHYIYEDNNYEENDVSSPKIKEIIEAQRLICPTYINFGLTGSYRLTRELNLVLDINYRYPYTSAKVKITRETYNDDGRTEIIDCQTYHSRSWGNNLTISIGFQFQCELSKR